MQKSPPEFSSALPRWLFVSGFCAVILVLACNLLTIGHQAPWEDEVFAVSTGLSLARSQPPILSVLAQYPGTGSPILFYGPVSFEVEALLIRVFGLSLVAWRLACFAGVILSVFAGWRLVKLAGGGRWAQLITALALSLAGSVGSPLPGRWDAVTSGLFLCGLLLLLPGIEIAGRVPFWESISAGTLIAFALASTPRAITLSLAALVALAITGLCTQRLRKTCFAAVVIVSCTGLLVHSFLLIPWGQNSISWFAYLKSATSRDKINATPLTGEGTWSLDLQHHKILTLLLVVLLATSVFSAIRQKLPTDLRKMPLKQFLAFFASINLTLMLLTLTNALGQAMFWLPPVVIATMCWINWESLRDAGVAKVGAFLIGVCLLLPCLEEVEQTAAVILTWDRRSTAALTAFVERNIPAGATVYGPIGGYFYPVELSGHQYLYPYEQTTPGLYSESQTSIADKLDEEICSHRAYAIWPKPDTVRHPQQQPMPEALRERLQGPLAEFGQPPLARWKDLLLQQIGDVGGKYGFPDVLLYSLKSQRCGRS
jgi:hypothetical protein